MREKFPGFTISLPPELTANLNIPQGMSEPAKTIDDYVDYYRTLDELVDPVFEKAIEGGYIDQSRATDLASWLDQHPLITALYPYRQLRQALAIATTESGWSDAVESGLLQFFAALPDAFELVQLPEELFGDMYAAIFDEPSGPVDLRGQSIEVTGPCEKGSHNAMIERAIAWGSFCSYSYQRSGCLFVARSHIEIKAVSSKIAAFAAGRMKYGSAVKILAEEHYPFECQGSRRTPAGGYEDGVQRDTLRALLYFLETTGQMQETAPAIISEAYLRLYGVSIINDDAARHLIQNLQTPSRQAFRRIIGSINKSGDQGAKEFTRLQAQRITAAVDELPEAAAEALDYMIKRFAKVE